MSLDFITRLILEYRYWILIPLSFIEGPIIAFVAGTLASVGYFNMYFLAPLFFIRDVGLDGVYYAIGYFGARSGFAQRMMAKLGVTEDHLDEIRVLWTKRPGITLFIGKLSYGIASAFIVVAGMIRMPLGKFFAYGSLVAIVQYGGLLFLGYFVGSSLGGDVIKIINNIQYVVAFTAIIISAYYILSWRMRSKILASHASAEKGEMQ